MASIAAAIEKETVQKANAELWWDSHASLFQTLDKCVAGDPTRSSEKDAQSMFKRKVQQQPSNTEAVLAEVFHGCHQWLLKTVTLYKPPSATSRAALNSSKVAVGDHVLNITAELRDLALRVSTVLVLDEIQSYILASRVLESNLAASSMTGSGLLSAIVMNYYLERQSILKSTRLLLTCRMAEDDTVAEFSQTINVEVTKLLNEGLEDKILGILNNSLSSMQPQHLDRDYADLWAEETALEQTLLLDILFLLYYEPLCICNFTRLKNLMDIFQEVVIWNKGEMLALTSETEKILQQARRQAILLIVEALDLESLLLMVQSDTPFSQNENSLSVEDVRQLDGMMAKLDPESAPECGPVFLGWATFLCLMSFLPLPEGQGTLGYLEHTVYVRQAYGAGAYNYLLEMLRDEYFQGFDIQGGYKSVIKTLVSAFLAAYDPVSQMNIDGHEVIIDILCELYRGQEALCLELWDRDSVIDAPIRSLLFLLRDSFPHQTLSLVRLLAAQCEGSWPAECVYDFLYNMVEMTSLYQRDELALANESRSMVQTSITLQVPDAPGLLIPAGTSGCILRELSGNIYLVRWQCKNSGMVVLLLRMLQRSISSYQKGEVLAILDLLNRMLSANTVLTQLLLDLDRSAATITARANGCMESSLRLDVVSMICSVINASMQNSGDDVMIASCIGILTSFSLSCPKQVMTALEQSLLLQPSGVSSDAKAFPGSQLHELVVKTEQSTGHYPLTNAVLDFTKTMVEKGIANPTKSPTFTSLLMHVIGNVFVNHGNWKYQQWHERLMITTKVLWIMRSIVTSIIRTREVRHLKEVLELLLYDSIVHDVLISVLSVGAQELEGLHFNRAVGIKEIEWLQQAIYTVLMLLHDLILDVTIGVCSKDYSGAMLEQTLFRKTTGPLPVVTAIATFLSFSRNEDLQFASAKALTSLCLLAQKSRQNPGSLPNYISSTEQKVTMRSAITELLSEDKAIANCPLFEAVIDLLTGAVKWQPALVELLLFPMEQPAAVAKGASDQGGCGISVTVNCSTSPNATSVTEVLDALWKWVTHSPTISTSHPQILSRVLFLLASVWEAGIEYLRIIETLRSKPQFWEQLTTCLSYGNLSTATMPTLLARIKEALDPEKPGISGMNNDEVITYSFRYTCEACVLSIMTHDIFLQQHLLHLGTREVKNLGGVDSGSSKIGSDSGKQTTKGRSSLAISGALPIVLEWCKGSQMSTIMLSYALCIYDKTVVLRAKAEARVLMIGLMGKVLSGDSRGLNASLAKRIQDAAEQVIQHPSFEELSEQYSSRGYSHGEQLQVLLISDLFQHLQGELDGGRPIPSGSFQLVAEFLATKEVDSLLNPVVPNQLPDLHPTYGDTFMYDTPALEAELGLEWWGHASFGTVTAHIAENTLKSIQHANAIASLGHSQLSALQSWSALLTVAVFSKHEAQTGCGGSISPSDWSEAKLTSYSTELCLALEGILAAIGPIGDATNFTPGFITSQGRLLLVFIRWLSSTGASSSQKPFVWTICARLIRTVVGCLEKLLDAQCPWHQQVKDLIKSFFGALLLLLEFMHSQMSQTADDGQVSGEKSGGHGAGKAYADVTLVGLGFLPSLCQAVEDIDYADSAIAIINVLIKGFLAPSTWFPVLQNHFPLATSLSRMHKDPKGADSSTVMLNFCLSFVGLKGGAELLHIAGFFSQLHMLNLNLSEDMSLSSTNMEGPFSVWLKHSEQGQHGGAWSLGIAVAAGLVRSLGDKDPNGTVIQNAVTYIRMQKDRIMGALRAPTSIMDLQGKKKAKVQLPRTTLSALRDTEHVIALLCEVSHHQAPWILRDSIFDLGERVVHLLAFIAREGLVHPGSGIRSGTGMGFSCQPLQKDEIVAHKRPPLINSNSAWFAVTARGCAAGDITPSLSSVRSISPSRTSSHSLTLSPSRRASSLSPSNSMGGSGSSTVGLPSSEYSNMVAIQIYKLCFLLLRFLCQEAQHATRKVEEGGQPDYSHFPELPAPEILHGLQDQVVPVVTDICGKTPNRTAQEVCLLLVTILEMSLYLEVLISKTCGVGPLPLRSDDFSKDYRTMLQAGHAHAFLEPSLQSLSRIMSSAYPDLI